MVANRILNARHARILGSALILVHLVGCSAFKQATQVVSITADPPDAQIYINGSMAGQGSASGAVKRNENVQIMVRKTGYETVQRTIGSHFSGYRSTRHRGRMLVARPIYRFGD